MINPLFFLDTISRQIAPYWGYPKESFFYKNFVESPVYTAVKQSNFINDTSFYGLAGDNFVKKCFKNYWLVRYYLAIALEASHTINRQLSDSLIVERRIKAINEGKSIAEFLWEEHVLATWENYKKDIYAGSKNNLAEVRSENSKTLDESLRNSFVLSSVSWKLFTGYIERQIPFLTPLAQAVTVYTALDRWADETITTSLRAATRLTLGTAVGSLCYISSWDARVFKHFTSLICKTSIATIYLAASYEKICGIKGFIAENVMMITAGTIAGMLLPVLPLEGWVKWGYDVRKEFNKARDKIEKLAIASFEGKRREYNELSDLELFLCAKLKETSTWMYTLAFNMPMPPIHKDANYSEIMLISIIDLCALAVRFATWPVDILFQGITNNRLYIMRAAFIAGYNYGLHLCVLASAGYISWVGKEHATELLKDLIWGLATYDNLVNTLKISGQLGIIALGSAVIYYAFYKYAGLRESCYNMLVAIVGKSVMEELFPPQKEQASAKASKVTEAQNAEVSAQAVPTTAEARENNDRILANQAAADSQDFENVRRELIENIEPLVSRFSPVVNQPSGNEPPVRMSNPSALNMKPSQPTMVQPLAAGVVPPVPLRRENTNREPMSPLFIPLPGDHQLGTPTPSPSGSPRSHTDVGSPNGRGVLKRQCSLDGDKKRVHTPRVHTPIARSRSDPTMDRSPDSTLEAPAIEGGLAQQVSHPQQFLL